MMPDTIERLKSSIRDVPNFPKKGIIFKDITTLIGKGELFKLAIDQFAGKYTGKKIDKIVVIESRGFIFGAPVAYKLGAGLVPVRKKGKLPYKTIAASYSLEYGTDTLEMHEDAIEPGENVLIIDDLLATGGTVSAVSELINKAGGNITGMCFLIELSFLKGREKLKDFEIFSLISY
jgi:adenine phosphoribosyltransferase